MTQMSSQLSDDVAAPTSPRRTFESPLVRVGLGVVGVAILGGLWQAAAMSGQFGSGLPTVGATLGALGALVVTPQMWVDTAVTVGLAVVGLLVAMAIGGIVGVLVGAVPPVRAALTALLEFLKPMPPVVILPLAVMIFGPTGQMAVFLVVVGCAIGISILVTAGVRDSDPVARDTAHAFGLGPVGTLRSVVLPATLPFVGTAIRTAAPASMMIVVAAGLLGGAPGLGRSVYLAQAGGTYPTLYALVIVLGVLGLGSQWLSSAAERRILHWHPAFRRMSS